MEGTRRVSFLGLVLESSGEEGEVAEGSTTAEERKLAGRQPERQDPGASGAPPHLEGDRTDQLAALSALAAVSDGARFLRSRARSADSSFGETMRRPSTIAA